MDLSTVGVMTDIVDNHSTANSYDVDDDICQGLEMPHPTIHVAPAMQSPTPSRVQQTEYPFNVTVDFTKLRANALRRYMVHHDIQEIPGSSQQQLAVVVARHFNEECKLTDEETSIASFLTYIKSSQSELGEESTLRWNKENSGHVYNAASGDRSVEHVHGMEGQNEGARASQSQTAKKTKSSFPSQHSVPAASMDDSTLSSKKKRKTRLYCVCKADSFGNMIACDNKTCLDRSNWYHMECVGLDSSVDAPETWLCPICQEQDRNNVPENQYRKPVASVTYGDMIAHALMVLPHGKGSFKAICDFVEQEYESQLNWKLESDQRKSPVWKSSVRKILFSNIRFRKHPKDKGLFCLAA